MSKSKADVDLELGNRLRTLRLSRGMSQRALAKSAGITSSTISLIESGKMNPSVGALKRVLGGIPIGLADFFAYDPVVDEQIFFQAEDLVEIGNEGISLRQVGHNNPGCSIQIVHEIYRPGKGTGSILLSHEGEEGGIVLRGRLEITVENERKLLGPGDAYLFKSRRPHSFRAVGHEICEVISACSPPTF